MRKDYSVIESFVNRYAQAQGADTNTSGEEVAKPDPASMEVGQSVYDQSGTEFVVVESGQGAKVLMPADQKGSEIPQGVQSVDDATVGAQYTLQPKTTAACRKAQALDWEDIQSAATDVLALSRRRQLKPLIEAMDALNSLILGSVEMPDDLNEDDLV